MELTTAEVFNLRLNFVFNEGALLGPEETREEIQDFFTEPVEFEDFVAGQNTAKVAGKSFGILIE